MHLQLTTWPEVVTYLESSRGIIVPVSAAFSEIHAELAEAAAMRGPGANKMPMEVFCQLANWFDQPTVSKMRDEMYGD